MKDSAFRHHLDDILTYIEQLHIQNAFGGYDLLLSHELAICSLVVQYRNAYTFSSPSCTFNRSTARLVELFDNYRHDRDESSVLLWLNYRAERLHPALGTLSLSYSFVLF